MCLFVHVCVGTWCVHVQGSVYVCVYVKLLRIFIYTYVHVLMDAIFVH